MACKNLTNLPKKVPKFKIVDLLAELKKRVPKNQKELFNHFTNMCHKYQARVDKFPEKLPRIDWDYYRANVRKDYIKMVDDFEIKYEELNKIFDNRSQVDTSKYMKDVDRVKEDVKVEVEKFIKESNERIKKYEEEIERLRKLIPYEEMTCEEYCELGPEYALSLGVGNSFWPHTPEEQFGYVRPEPELTEEQQRLLEEQALKAEQSGRPLTAGSTEAPEMVAPSSTIEEPDTTGQPTAATAATPTKPKPTEKPESSEKATPKPTSKEASNKKDSESDKKSDPEDSGKK